MKLLELLTAAEIRGYLQEQGEIMGKQLYTTKGFLYLPPYPSNYWVEYCWGGLVSFPLLLGGVGKGTYLWIL